MITSNGDTYDDQEALQDEEVQESIRLFAELLSSDSQRQVPTHYGE